MESIMALEITSMLAIGNGEKCPFCELIVEEDTDTFKHMIDHHQESLNNELFGDENNG
tara:strand:- start:34 stop:207 length:174 start_codon:yes stop_codon:yes gene_type:complete